MNRTNDDAEAAKRVVRKPYTAPRLISYGHVKDIVQGGGGTKANDPGTGRATKPCWVAEALYGPDAARTTLLRAWLSEILVHKRRGWRLVSMYIACGPRVADLLQSGRLPRRPFLRGFDALTRRAFDESVAVAKARRADAP